MTHPTAPNERSIDEGLVEARPRVLVAEDDAQLAASIVRGLRAEGFEVELATDGEQALHLGLRGDFRAIVLDLNLPEKSGIEVLEALRARVRTPVLVVTARSDLAERLRCFALGAVDFVPKPFWIEELVARLRAHVGRKPSAPNRRVEIADALVDLDARTMSVAGAAVEVTPSEWAVLAYLIERQGRAVSRAQLADDALDAFDEVDARTVDSHVAHLRKKLGNKARASIATVWGIGYRFDPQQASR
ncbi:MAG: response regulator transcription factor [Polyangiales bacterium]